ncbi:hypothetical protein SAMN02745857_02874 [Andreprevotia lacus DSM 23236]|jgi:hypothetical protein|uniref:Uncharacterized protein n=1 Tax=Andreprevotia lacus DSM 23236 TaxID=1121001 RepID=A0A1W1XUD1_9NEIS|nr:hypothetical protein [Andreprevotia lacus]SMC27497.1 hypothetical protein SAMN02745857_02874 [Andreprevotia lacus DSM 23236]
MQQAKVARQARWWFALWLSYLLSALAVLCWQDAVRSWLCN